MYLSILFSIIFLYMLYTYTVRHFHYGIRYIADYNLKKEEKPENEKKEPNNHYHLTTWLLVHNIAIIKYILYVQ